MRFIHYSYSAMKRVINKLTTSQWIVIALSALAYMVLAWNYHDRVSHFEASHRTLAKTTSVEVANQVSFILAERQRQVKLFVEYSLPLLRMLQGNPDNPATHKEMARALKHAFPDFFAFTVTDAKGEPFIADFDGYIGDTCIQDIQGFAKSGRYAARIHPNNHQYHYDIMAGWRGEDGAHYMLMVSFEPKGLGQMLKAIQPPDHELMLISNTQPPLIEVTTQGARDMTPRNDYRLSPSDQQRLLARTPVPLSMWAVADFVQPGFFETYRRQAQINLVLFASLFGLAIGASLVMLQREARRREAAEQAREDLLSVITHEMRTPVTALCGTLSLLGHGVMGEIPATIKSSIDLLDRNATRLRRLIDDLLEVWKIELGQLSIEKQRVNLKQIVDETILSLRDYAGQVDVSIALVEADEDIWVEADPVRIQQVATNLISNAVKFSPKGRMVQVRIINFDRLSARVSVTDEGPGIPDTFRPRVFKKFARGPAPENCQIASTGLGLSIVKALVEAHGGDVGFETQVGKGSTFYFDLPRM